MPGDKGIDDLLGEFTARDFVTDAFAHCKFIGYVDAAVPLFAKAGIADTIDEGFIELGGPANIDGFIDNLGKLRL